MYRHREGHPRTRLAGVRDPDAAAVRLDDGAGDGEPQPGAADRPRGIVAAAVEAVEHARRVVDRDAGAGVGDLEPHRAVLAVGRDRYRTADGRVGDGVLEQVEQHALQAL